MRKREASFINIPTSKMSEEEEKDGPEIEIIRREGEVVTESDIDTYDTNHSDYEFMLNEEYLEHLNSEENYGLNSEESYISGLTEYENDITVIGRMRDTFRENDILSVNLNSLRREHVNTGLNNNEINNLCSNKYSDIITKIVECGICKGFFVDFNTVTELWCSHIFHSTCLIPWLILNNSCPMCRQHVVER